MHLIDILIVGILLVSAMVGLRRGFLYEVVSLTAWLVALWGGYAYAPLGAEYLLEYVGYPPLRTVISFTGIFLVLLAFVSGLGQVLFKLLSFVGLGGIDRPLGMMFGFARGVILVSVLNIWVVAMQWNEMDWWKNGALVERFEPVVEFLQEVIPEDLDEVITSVPKVGEKEFREWTEEAEERIKEFREGGGEEIQEGVQEFGDEWLEGELPILEDN